MTGAGLVVLLVLLGVGGTLLLSVLIERETDDLPRMSRSAAERAARRDRSDDADDGPRDGR